MNLNLYLVIDDTFCKPENMAVLVNQLLDCGITCVQLRIKNSPSKLIAKTGLDLLTILKPKKISLIINDHIETVAQINADGVHIGQKDIAYFKAREYLGYNKIIGLSIENIEQAKQCQYLDVDYFGVGPIFATKTKLDAANPIGIQQLRLITNLLNKPIVAIGGINKNNITSVLASGVSGVALISAILGAPSPETETKQFAKIISREKYEQY